VAGIVLLAVALLWFLGAWMGPVVQFLLLLFRLLIRPFEVVWLTARHWNPFVWRGSPIGWRGFPDSRDEWREALDSADEWHPLYTTGVTRAVYFTPNVSVDVTETVRGLVDSSGHLVFVVSNGSFPGDDPEYGVPKELCIHYVVNGETSSATYRENQTVDLQGGTEQGRTIRLRMLKAALNGARLSGSHPALPISAAELAAAAVACVEAGANALHIHPRGPDGAESLAGDIIDETVRAVRSVVRVPVGVSTGAWIEPDLDRRIQLISSWREPSMASVNISEEGWEAVIRALLAAGVGVEAGLWSVEDAERLGESGLADRLLRVLVEVVHPVPDPAAEALAIDTALDWYGIGAPRLHHGEEDGTWSVLHQAIVLGRDIRIGLEDTLRFADGSRAGSNEALVKAARTLITRT
jgi:uncharacterized protein (DUF849 family)